MLLPCQLVRPHMSDTAVPVVEVVATSSNCAGTPTIFVTTAKFTICPRSFDRLGERMIGTRVMIPPCDCIIGYVLGEDRSIPRIADVFEDGAVGCEALLRHPPTKGVIRVMPPLVLRSPHIGELVESVVAEVPDCCFARQTHGGFADNAARCVVVVPIAAVPDEEVVVVFTSVLPAVDWRGGAGRVGRRRGWLAGCVALGDVAEGVVAVLLGQRAIAGE